MIQDEDVASLEWWVRWEPLAARDRLSLDDSAAVR